MSPRRPGRSPRPWGGLKESLPKGWGEKEPPPLAPDLGGMQPLRQPGGPCRPLSETGTVPQPPVTVAPNGRPRARGVREGCPGGNSVRRSRGHPRGLKHQQENCQLCFFCSFFFLKAPSAHVPEQPGCSGKAPDSPVSPGGLRGPRLPKPPLQPQRCPVPGLEFSRLLMKLKPREGSPPPSTAVC